MMKQLVIYRGKKNVPEMLRQADIIENNRKYQQAGFTKK